MFAPLGHDDSGGNTTVHQSVGQAMGPGKGCGCAAFLFMRWLIGCLQLSKVVAPFSVYDNGADFSMQQNTIDFREGNNQYHNSWSAGRTKGRQPLSS